MSSSSSGDNLAPAAALNKKQAVITKVLTQGVLFRHITSFISDCPHFVLEFEQAMKGKYLSRSLWAALGSMLHVAMSENNERVLRTLYELVRAPKYCYLPKLQPSSVNSCFDYKRSTRMLSLIKE